MKIGGDVSYSIRATITKYRGSVVDKQLTFISHRPGGWKVQDQGFSMVTAQ